MDVYRWKADLTVDGIRVKGVDDRGNRVTIDAVLHMRPSSRSKASGLTIATERDGTTHELWASPEAHMAAQLTGGAK